MKSDNFLNVAFVFGVLGLIGWIVFPGTILAQSNAATPSGQRSTLNEPQKRGEGVFWQRCSLCHLAKVVKPRTRPSVGPSLSGLLKNDNSLNKEKGVRQIILGGGPNMPGFQYGLEPKEIDDLIAYLKTL